MMMHALQKYADILPAIQVIDDDGVFQQTLSLAIPVIIDDAVARS